MTKGIVELGTAWEVWTTVNEFDNLGEIVGYYSTQNAANKASMGKGWYGGKGSVQVKSTITVDGEIYVLDKKDPIKVDNTDAVKEAIIAKAKEKLTPEEIEALGI